LLKARKKSGSCGRRAVGEQCYAVVQKGLMASNREVAMEPKRRKLVWAEKPKFQGWVCTQCAWVFNPSWPPVGKTIEEMKTDFGQQRDKEFASHVCSEHPRATKNPG
jgi:rubredoxin